MPEVYSGDEIAMEGGDDPDNRRDFPGGFTSSSHDAFTAAGRTQGEQEMFAWAAGLFHLRGGACGVCFRGAAGCDGGWDGDRVSAREGTWRGMQSGWGGADSGGGEQGCGGAGRGVEYGANGVEKCTSFKAMFPATAGEVKAGDGKVTVPVGANGAGIYGVQ